MKIARVETIPIWLPTRREHKWASSGATPIGTWVILKLYTDDGLVGLGEAPALKEWGGDYMRYYGESPKSVCHIVGDYLIEAIRGEDPCSIERIHEKMDRAVKGHPYAKAAIDMACYDLWGKALGVPAYQLLGGLYRREVPLAHSIGLMELKKALAEIEAALTEGIKTIKLKVGLDPSKDIELMKQARAIAGPEVAIKIDANQGYSPKRAIKVIKEMEKYDLLLAEQPVEGVDAMAQVCSSVDTPIMADESAWTPQDVIELKQKRAADMISIYWTKPGGLFKAKKVAAVAEACGMPCNVNGSGETGVGNAANIHLAASTRIINLPSVFAVTSLAEKEVTKIAGRFYLDDLLKEPYGYKDGSIIVPQGPGLGIELDERKLKKYSAAA